MTLTTPEVAEVCKYLRVPDDEKLRIAPGAYYRLYPELTVSTDQSHPRTRFTIACHTISTRLLELEPSLLLGETEDL
jgi:hypothetical protein